jgi:hypothetical protein
VIGFFLEADNQVQKFRRAITRDLTAQCRSDDVIAENWVAWVLENAIQPPSVPDNIGVRGLAQNNLIHADSSHGQINLHPGSQPQQEAGGPIQTFVSVAQGLRGATPATGQGDHQVGWDDIKHLVAGL